MRQKCVGRVEFITQLDHLNMSEEGGRRFRLAKSVNEEEEAIQNVIPPSTRYKTKWAVELFREWQTARGQAGNEGDGLQDISTLVENFDTGSLAYRLRKFVQEVVNKDGQRYENEHTRRR